MKQTDRPITAIKVNNPEIRDIINKLSEPIHRQRFTNPLQFRRTCSTNELRFNGARCGNGALKKRERERETEKKREVKGTRDAFTPGLLHRVRTRNNVHYASLTRFLPPRVFFRGRKMPRGRRGAGRGRQSSGFAAASLLATVTQPPPPLGPRVVESLFPKKGGEKEVSDFRGVQSDF